MCSRSRRFHVIHTRDCHLPLKTCNYGKTLAMFQMITRNPLLPCRAGYRDRYSQRQVVRDKEEGSKARAVLGDGGGTNRGGELIVRGSSSCIVPGQNEENTWMSPLACQDTQRPVQCTSNDGIGSVWADNDQHPTRFLQYLPRCNSRLICGRLATIAKVDAMSTPWDTFSSDNSSL